MFIGQKKSKLFTKNPVILVIFFAFYIAATGFDLLSINTASFNVRIVYLLFTIYFLNFKDDIISLFGNRKNTRNFIVLFVLFSIPSIFISLNQFKSLLYLVWIILNYLVIFTTFALFSSHPFYKAYLFTGVVVSFRIQILISLVLYFLKIGIDGRAHLLYYEPSYFAFALVLYIAFIVHRIKKDKDRWILLDILLLFCAFLTTQSFNLVLAVFLCMLCSLFIGKSNKRIQSLLFLALGISFLVFLGFLYIQNVDDLIATRVKATLSSADMMEYLFGAGGNRIPRRECAWATFIEHKWFGVGIGAYDSYTYGTNIPECTAFANNPDLTPIGSPATNIYVELLATVGIFGSWPIFLFFGYVLTRKDVRKLDKYQSVYFTASLSLLVLLQFESNYLRLYLWMILGMYYGSTLENFNHNE